MWRDSDLTRTHTGFGLPGAIDCDPYLRMAQIFRVRDGDWVEFHANLGYNQWAAYQHGLIRGVRSLRRKGRQTEERLGPKYALKSLLDTYCRPRGNEWCALIRTYQAKTKYVKKPQDAGNCWIVDVYGWSSDGKPISINQLMQFRGWGYQPVTKTFQVEGISDIVDASIDS